MGQVLALVHEGQQVGDQLAADAEVSAQAGLVYIGWWEQEQHLVPA
jgi:hypothetical protein